MTDEVVTVTIFHIVTTVQTTVPVHRVPQGEKTLNHYSKHYALTYYCYLYSCSEIRIKYTV